ncbi:MAG: outer membrane beta-barrel protein [Ignavibacteriaceae bacterium]|nr:outer membrane beta-barrel protein [Ignavibacteriaceae bacterium]
MKKFSYRIVFILFIIPFIVGPCYAQEVSPLMHFSIFAGGAFPEGDFGSTSGEKAGYAKTGFSAMVQGDKSLSESIYWTSSISLAINSLDESSMRSATGVSGMNITTTNYYTTWVMTGVGFETPVSPTVKIYGSAQLGLLVSKFPDVTISYNGISVNQTADMATAFAYGFGAGFWLNNFNLGLRYYTGQPKYKETASYGNNSYSVNEDLPATVLQVMFGIRF